MSKITLQPIQNIAPVEEKKPLDPAQAQYEEGKESLKKQETAQAALSFHNALLAFEEAGNQNGVANASNQLGQICLQRQEFDSALKHFQRAWEICEKQNDPMSLLSLSGHLVAVHRGLKQFTEAVRICLDMIDSYHLNNNPQGVVETLEKMVDVYLDAGDRLKAADGYRTIASIHSRYKHKNIAERYMEKARELEAEAV